MGIKKAFNLLVIVSVLLLILGCGGGGKKESAEYISGLVQKGVFKSGEVVLKELNGASLGAQVSKSAINSNGEYKLNKPKKNRYVLIANGKFYDEITGNISSQNIELSALYDGNKKININLLTTLLTKRVLELLKSNKSYENALSIAKNDIKNAFGISEDVSKLNILDLKGDLKEQNYKLLIISLAFLNSYHQLTSQGSQKIVANSAINFNNFFNAMIRDFADNGKFDSDFKDKYNNINNIVSSKQEQIDLINSIKDNIQNINGLDDLLISNVIIKDAFLQSVTIDSKDINYTNEQEIFMGVDASNNPKINIKVKYSQKFNRVNSDKISVYLKYGINKKRLNINVSNPIPIFNSDDFIRLITINLNNQNVNILKNSYKNGLTVGFEIVIDDDKKILSNLPKFYFTDKMIGSDLNITNLTYLGKCQNYNDNYHILANVEAKLKTASVTFNSGCFKLTPNVNKGLFKIAIEDAQGIVNGDINLTISDIALNIKPTKVKKDGIYLQKIEIPLPKGHSIHKRDLNISNSWEIFNINYINPYGKDKLEIVANKKIASLGSFDLNVTLSEPLYLHANNLPIYFEIEDLSLSNNKIEFLNAKSVFAYEYQNLDSKNNANRFLNPSNNGFNLTLNANGLSSGDFIIFNGVNNLQTNFPQAKIDTGGFKFKLQNSDIVNIVANNDNNFELSYDSNCKGVKCSNIQTQLSKITLPTINDTKIYKDGASILAYNGNLPTISWGYKDSNAVFTRAQDKDAKIFIFGYEIATNSADEIINYLLGSAKDNTNNINYYSVNSNEAKKGRYYFAGINVGKEVIDDTNYNTTSTSLENKVMQIKLEDGQTLNIESNAYSKYYVRNSGITGVFNKKRAQNINTTIYGYTTSFDKFAFRQIENKIDEYTWIDGKFNIPNKGDFDIAFNSLRLVCNGSFKNANVIACTSNNSINCNKVIKAWRAKTRFYSLDFVGDNSCSANKSLEIGHIVDVIALKNRLNVAIKWNSNGTVKDSKLKGSAINQLDGDATKRDKDNNGGYDIKVTGIKMASNSSKDWFELNATVGVAFWDAFESSIIVKNKNVSARDYTILVNKGDLTKLDLTKSNLDLYKNIKKDYNITAHYSWGGLIPFNLPVYYESKLTDVPKFIGRKKENFDIKVLSLNSAISHITPNETSIKFGVSADFEKFDKLNLNIDLNDPESLKEIDNTLVDTLGIFSRNSENKGPMEATLGELIENINVANNFLKSSFDLTLEELAIKGLKELGKNDPAYNISEALKLAHSLPLVVNDKFKRKVKEGIVFILDNSFGKIEDAFNNATAGMTYANFAKANDALFKEVQAALSIVDKGVKEYEKLFKFISDVNKTLGDFNNTTQVAVNFYNTYIQYLKPKDNNKQCSWNHTSGHGIFKPVRDTINKVKNINNEIASFKISKIKNIAKNIEKYVGIDAKDLIDSAKKIKKIANDLTKMVLDGDKKFGNLFNKNICQNQDIENLLKNIENAVKELNNVQSAFANKLSLIKTALEDKGVVGKHIYAVAKFTKKLNAKIDALYKNENNIANDALTKFAKEIMSIKEIKEIFDTNTTNLTGIDVFRVPISHKLNGLVEKEIFKRTDDIAKSLSNTLPSMSADEVRQYIVTKFFELPPVKTLNNEVEKVIKPIADEVNKLALSVLGGFERAIRKTLAKASDEFNKVVNQAVGRFKNDVPVKSAKLDGYAIIRGDMLHQAHIGAEFKMEDNKKKSKDNTFTFEAALDMWQNSAKNSGGCAGSDFESAFNAQISARDIDMSIGSKGLKIDLVLIGVTMQQNGLPVGLFGAITSKGGFDFKKFKLYNLGLATGVGKFETYLGAKAKAKVDTVQLGANFLIGVLCNQEIQKNFIPEAIYDFITIPNNKFQGGLVFGEAQIPVWNNGCMLTVVARAKVGSWVLFSDTQPTIIGGLLGGAAFGQGLCIATLGGEVLLLAEYSGGNIRFQGDGWGAAGLGACDDSWDSVEDSRKDDWCGTGDAQFKARFDKGISLREIKFSAIH